MKNIANVINFARGCEPRCEDDSYLFPTLREEMELCKRYDFCSTVLLQYDALIRPDYRALLEEFGDAVEPGLWLEVVQPLAEAAGIPWRGRYVWDWDIRCNFLSAYTPDERKRMIDAAFRTFRDIFGAYPARQSSTACTSRSRNTGETSPSHVPAPSTRMQSAPRVSSVFASCTMAAARPRKKSRSAARTDRRRRIRRRLFMRALLSGQMRFLWEYYSKNLRPASTGICEFGVRAGEKRGACLTGFRAV